VSNQPSDPQQTERDAARYRYLRANRFGVLGISGKDATYGLRQLVLVKPEHAGRERDALDEAIDQAIAADEAAKVAAP
jgi:hypothetical protein